LWNPTGEKTTRTLTELGRNNAGLLYLDDGDMIVGTRDGVLKHWHGVTRLVTTNATLPSIPITPFAYLPKRNAMLTEHGNSSGKRMALWNLSSWKVQSWFTNTGYVKSRTVSQDERWVAAGYVDGRVELFDLLAANQKGVSWQAHKRAVTGVTFQTGGNGCETKLFH
jgi:hypothetical protein